MAGGREKDSRDTAEGGMRSPGVRLHRQGRWQRDSPAEGPACEKAQSLRGARQAIPWTRRSPEGKVSQGSSRVPSPIAPNQGPAACPAKGDGPQRLWRVQGVASGQATLQKTQRCGELMPHLPHLRAREGVTQERI